MENGTHRVYRQTHLSRMVFPQELRGLVALAGGFEFVQWFFGFKPHQVLEQFAASAADGGRPSPIALTHHAPAPSGKLPRA